MRFLEVLFIESGSIVVKQDFTNTTKRTFHPSWPRLGTRWCLLPPTLNWPSLLNSFSPTRKPTETCSKLLWNLGKIAHTLTIARSRTICGKTTRRRKGLCLVWSKTMSNTNWRRGQPRYQRILRKRPRTTMRRRSPFRTIMPRILKKPRKNTSNRLNLRMSECLWGCRTITSS